MISGFEGGHLRDIGRGHGQWLFLHFLLTFVVKMRFAFFAGASGFDESCFEIAFGQAVDQPLFFAAGPQIKDFVPFNELGSLISLAIEILR